MKPKTESTITSYKSRANDLIVLVEFLPNSTWNNSFQLFLDVRLKGTQSPLRLRWPGHFEKSLPQPEIKVHLEIRFIFRSVLLDFQSFTEKPIFECPFAHPMILFLSYLDENSIYRVSVICKISYEMVCNTHVRQLTVSP